MFCAKIVPIVNELEKEYAGKLEFAVVNHDEGDAQARIKKYELDRHGMVLTDQDDKIVWKESGHLQTREGIKKALDAALAE